MSDHEEIRYCITDDGVRIAYRVSGDGPVTLVKAPNTFIPLLVMEQLPTRRDLADRLTSCFRYVRYDQRGTGMSQREVEDISPSTWVTDLRAVVQTMDDEPFVLFGNLSGSYIALRYVAENPGRASHLILWPPPPIPAADSGEGRALGQLARANWEAFTENYAHYAAGWAEGGEAHGLARLIRESITRDTFFRYMNVWIRDIPPESQVEFGRQVRTPTLILQRSDAKSEEFAALAASIPGARVRILDGDSTLAAVGDRAAVVAAIADFVGIRQPAVPVTHDLKQAQIVTILVTDVVAHTEMMQRLGDDGGRTLLREHERITRELLKQHGGAEVKTMGDGFMASFPSATKAMDCAIALQRAFARFELPSPLVGEGLGVRVGLNAGEPIEEDGDLFGSTVILASRICAQAGPGEILIPEALRHLLAGKPYTYADRGEATLKGFEDPVRLYEVRWHE